MPSEVCAHESDEAIRAALTALLLLFDHISIDYHEESVAQSQIDEYFKSLGLRYVREHRLPCGGIIDFYFPNSKVGLEVKASKSWSKKAVYRQCESYLKNSEIKGLVLATGRAQGLPSQMSGKPVVVYQLSRGAL